MKPVQCQGLRRKLGPGVAVSASIPIPHDVAVSASIPIPHDMNRELVVDGCGSFTVLSVARTLMYLAIAVKSGGGLASQPMSCI